MGHDYFLRKFLIHEEYDSFVRDTMANTAMEWRKCIECLNLQVSFRKRATNYRALLQKTTQEDKASYGRLPPCTYVLRIQGGEDS